MRSSDQASYKLKETKLWVAEELTQAQLENNATELAKAKGAR